MIRSSSPYNDALSPKDSDDTRDAIDNKGLNVANRSSINKDSSPNNDTLSPKRRK